MEEIDHPGRDMEVIEAVQAQEQQRAIGPVGIGIAPVHAPLPPFAMNPRVEPLEELAVEIQPPAIAEDMPREEELPPLRRSIAGPRCSECRAADRLVEGLVREPAMLVGQL